MARYNAYDMLKRRDEITVEEKNVFMAMLEVIRLCDLRNDLPFEIVSSDFLKIKTYDNRTAFIILKEN